MESRRAILESLSLPKGQCLPQDGDYVQISEVLLQRRGLEVTKQFEVERFQILHSRKTQVCALSACSSNSLRVMRRKHQPLFCFLPHRTMLRAVVKIRARFGRSARVLETLSPTRYTER